VDEQTPQPGEDEVGGTRQRGSEGEAQGSTASNQGKAEPMPSTPGHKDPNAPLEPPSLEDMNVGSADPQLPRHPLATRSGLELHEPVTPAPADVGGPGSAPAEQRPAASTGSSTGRASGPEHPAETSEGTAHKAPGIQGSTGSDEVLETDVVSSAARMGPSGPGSIPSDGSSGDPQGVDVPSTTASLGTSEEHDVVQGARTPTHDR
jgi:hypothetical protein